MKSASPFFALPFASLALLVACSSATGTGSGAGTDSCAALSQCCASQATALASACQTQLSAAKAESDAQTACGLLLQGYQNDGLCSGASTTSGDGGPPTGTAPDGGVLPSSEGVTLTAQSARQIASVGTVAPPSGGIFVAVAINLANDSTVSLPLTLSLFTIEDTTGLAYPASGETAAYVGGCETAATLTSGHSVACTVVFETPYASVTTSVAYTLPDGSHVSASLSTVPCSLCDGACVDLQTDPANCGACGNDVAQSGGTCQGGALACASNLLACDGACVDAQTDSSNCGACGKTCGIPGILPVNCLAGQCEACTPGATACVSSTSMETCGSDGQWGAATACSVLCTNDACANGCPSGESQCGSTCVDLQTDTNNCGGCGVACSGTCASGECVTTVTAVPSTESIESWQLTAAGIYWFDASGNLSKTPLTGGAATPVASAQTNAYFIGADAQNVYWFTLSVDAGGNYSGFALMQAPLVGGSASQVFAATSEYVSTVTYANGTVYWATGGTQPSGTSNASIMKAVPGGATTTIATDQGFVTNLAVDASNVYWPVLGTYADSYNDGTVMKASLADGTVSTLATAQVEPEGVAVGPAGLTWLTGYEGDTGVTISIVLLPPGATSATTPTTLESTSDGIGGFALDGTTVYWLDQEFQQVMKTVNGGNPTPLCSATEGSRGVAIDATSVYWYDGTAKNILRATPR
jgi:hypothetical protein